MNSVTLNSIPGGKDYETDSTVSASMSKQYNPQTGVFSVTIPHPTICTRNLEPESGNWGVEVYSSIQINVYLVK